MTTVPQAAANCLKIQDVAALNVAMCLMVDASSSKEGEVVAVANMTIYDGTYAGAAISEWRLMDKTFLMKLRAMVDDITTSQQSNPQVDATGNVQIDYYSDDTEIQVNLVNEGYWYPMVASLLT